MAAPPPPAKSTVKIIVVGDTVVGKTSVILNYFHGARAGSTISTIGVDYQKGDLIVDGETYQLQVWDTAGQDRFRSISVSYFRRGDVILLFYAVDVRETFEHVSGWAESIDRNKQRDDIPVILVGNKIDLIETRVVSTKEGSDLAEQFKWPYCETSALNGDGIKELFEMAVREVAKGRSHTAVTLNDGPKAVDWTQPAPEKPAKGKRC
jgi:small GTP-binding protein